MAASEAAPTKRGLRIEERQERELSEHARTIGPACPEYYRHYRGPVLYLAPNPGKSGRVHWGSGPWYWTRSSEGQYSGPQVETREEEVEPTDSDENQGSAIAAAVVAVATSAAAALAVATAAEVVAETTADIEEVEAAFEPQRERTAEAAFEHQQRRKVETAFESRQSVRSLDI